jgi:hypothetical protein
MVVDSMSIALRSYPGDLENTPSRGKAGAMAGGMEVADQEFCRDTQSNARTKGCLIGIIGSKEVPFYENLEGLVEGMIDIVSPGAFTVRYRGASKVGTKARSASRVITIPSWALALAAQHLGYSPLDSGEPQSIDPLQAQLR